MKNKNNIKTILFDFDGVIVDSFQLAFEVNKIVRPWINLTKDDYRRCLEGNLYEEFLKIDKKQKAVNKHKVANEHFFRVYVPRFLKLPIIKGIPKMLKALSKEYRLIIISSTISSPISEWLTKHNLAKYFSEIMGSDVHKSKLEKIRMIFKKYGINSDDCVFITDTLGDLREAKKAGLNCLAVTYGFHNKDTLEKGNPVGFIQSPQDILIEIKKYWQENKERHKK